MKPLPAPFPVQLRTTLICFASHLVALAHASPPQVATTDAVVNQVGSEFIRDQRHVGLSVGIFKGGTRYTYNFGTVDRSVHRLPSDRTIYEIASATKTYTGILLAQAVIDRKVRLDDDVHQYLTEPLPESLVRG